MVCSNRNTMSCVGHCVLLKLWWMGKCSEEIKRMIRGFKKINYEERLKSTDTTVRPLLVIFECWWWLKEVPDDWEKAAVTCFWKRAGRMIKWTIGHSVSLHSLRGLQRKDSTKIVFKHVNDKNVFENRQHGFTKAKVCLTDCLLGCYWLSVWAGGSGVCHLPWNKQGLWQQSPITNM